MKITKALAIVLLLSLLSGCIPSLHGIVTDADRITDDRILGTWTYDENLTQAALPQFLNQNLPENSRKELAYTFERALNVVTREPGTTTQTSWEGITRSSLPTGEVVMSEEALPYYILTHREIIDGRTLTSQLKVEMTRINQHHLLDIMPVPAEGGIFEGRFATNYILAHTFASIEFDGEDLLIRSVDAEHIEKLISQKRIRLKHERRNEEEIILTASTPELREFLDNYSDDPDLFESDDRLHKVKS